MTWFHIPKKKIVLDFYTSRAEIFELAPIQKTIKFLPNWWKDLPRTTRLDNVLADRPTMKSCSGFLELYKAGFVNPLWSDLSVRIGPKGTGSYRYQYSDGMSSAEIHPNAFRGAGFQPHDFAHLKLTSPWICRCEEEVKFAMFQPSWNFSSTGRPIIPPAIVDFKHQPGLHINMFIERGEVETEYLFEAGQPLLHYVPLDNRELDMRMHLVSQEEFARRNSIAINLKFIGKYRHIKNILSRGNS